MSFQVVSVICLITPIREVSAVWMFFFERLTYVLIETRPINSDLVKLQDEQIRRALLYALIPVVVAFSFVIFIFYRSRRESFYKQKEAEFRLAKAELELKALRAQINPHFIFNCLNSIHHYMHANSVNRAGDYLVKFSRLIRYALETSASSFVPLRDDLDSLSAYLELEQLRTQRSFEFEILLYGLEDPDALCIPPMMMQPFVENSIWHGFHGQSREGRITIAVRKNADLLECVIEDNGSRSKDVKDATSEFAKKTSMGMSLINDRLAVISEMYNVKVSFIVEDIASEKIHSSGTRVTLTLPFQN